MYTISYNKLFKKLIDKKMKKTEFARRAGISQTTLAKLSNNQIVSMDVIIKISLLLQCRIDDILDIIVVKNEIE